VNMCQVGVSSELNKIRGKRDMCQHFMVGDVEVR